MPQPMFPLAWAVIVFLVLVNALYVAGEFSAVGARRSRIRRLAAGGNRLAGRLAPVLEDPYALDRYIAASQIGITLSSLVLGAYAQAAIAPALEPLFAYWTSFEEVAAESAAITVVLVGLAALQVVVGELVPKALALQYPTRTALATVLPMRLSLRLFAWFIVVLNGSGLAVLRLLRLTYTGHRHVHSPEEIELLIAESRDGGLLEPEEHVRLHRALRLGLSTARELMVPRERIAGLSSDLPIEEVLGVAASSPYTRLPVYRGSLDDVAGILHTRDLALAYTRDARTSSIEPLLRPAVRVPADTPADRLLTQLRERRTHLALVLDHQERVVGLVTLEDVLTELLGDVSDEFKGQSGPRAVEARHG